MNMTNIQADVTNEKTVSASEVLQGTDSSAEEKVKAQGILDEAERKVEVKVCKFLDDLSEKIAKFEKECDAAVGVNLSIAKFIPGTNTAKNVQLCYCRDWTCRETDEDGKEVLYGTASFVPGRDLSDKLSGLVKSGGPQHKLFETSSPLVDILLNASIISAWRPSKTPFYVVDGEAIYDNETVEAFFKDQTKQ